MRRTLFCTTAVISMIISGRASFLSSRKRLISKVFRQNVFPTPPRFSSLQFAQNFQVEPPLLTKSFVRTLRVAELRELLQARAMDSTGLKKDLVERLLESINATTTPLATPEDQSDQTLTTVTSNLTIDPQRTYQLRIASYSSRVRQNAGCGFLLYDMESQSEVWCAYIYYNMLEYHNRFEFEYKSIASCLQYLHNHGVNELILASHSDLIIKQMMGELEVTRSDLKPSYWRAILAKEKFKTVQYTLLSTIENAKTLSLARMAVATKTSYVLHAEYGEIEMKEQRSPITSLSEYGKAMDSIIDPQRTYLLQIDGGSRGNPGISGTGVVFYDLDTNLEVWCGWKYIGDKVVNNVAEYISLLVGLKCAKSFGITKLFVESDSLLIIQQISGVYQVRNKDLQRMHRFCKEEIAGFESIQLQHIPRANNRRADELANQAMDSKDSWGLDDTVAFEIDECVMMLNEEGEGEIAVLPTDTTYSGSSAPAVSQIQVDKTYVLRFDGGSRGNPGKHGAGMVLYDRDLRNEIWCGWKYLGEMGTNNEAEYNALLLGVKCAKSLGVNHLIAEGDSLLAVKQLKGEWKVKERRMKVLCDQVVEETKSFTTFDVRHILREFNIRADELANLAMDTEESGGV